MPRSAVDQHQQPSGDRSRAILALLAVDDQRSLCLQLAEAPDEHASDPQSVAITAITGTTLTGRPEI